MNQQKRRVLLTVILAKLGVLAFGFVSFLLFSGEKITGVHEFLGIWNRWDAKSYIDLANYWYVSAGERSFQIVFFPLFPLLAAIFNFVTGDSIASAFVVSGIASIVLGLAFYKLVNLDHSEPISVLSVWFLFIFPTSYFLHIPYNESLFMAVAIASFYACRKKKWFLAGVLGFLACTTRINGLILCLALPLEVVEDWRERKEFDKSWLWLGLIPLGFVSYLVLNYVVTGDPVRFLEVQKLNFYRSLAFPWTGLWKKSAEVYNFAETEVLMRAVWELVFVGFGFIAIVAGWRHLRNSYRVWMIGSWLLFVSSTWILSVPRYTLTMFPIFVLMAIFAKNRTSKILISVFSIGLLGWFISLFVIGHWAF